ncbi:MAG: hypothetical protein ACI4XE_10285 [Acutalibacteraceae bacterium]
MNHCFFPNHLKEIRQPGLPYSVLGIAIEIFTANKATAKETADLIKAIDLMLSIKYTVGSAANLILRPGTAKQSTKYTARNTAINTAADTAFFFIEGISIHSFLSMIAYYIIRNSSP